MGTYCAVYGCFSSSKNDKDRRFFRFPRNKLRCKQWIKASNRYDLINKDSIALNKTYYVCDLHFQTSDRMVKKLKVNAIPTLNLPHQENVNPTKSTQTEDTMSKEATSFSLSTVSITATQTNQKLSVNIPHKRKLLNELKIECKKRRNLESDQNYGLDYKKNCNVSCSLKKLMNLKNLLKRKDHGNRHYCFKLFALNIFFASPLAYRILAKTLTLPSERILHRMNIKMGTTLYPDVLKCLEAKLASVQESEKYCVISADEMPLKRHLYYQMNVDKIIGFHEIDGVQIAEPATRAFVVMARGIFSNWKQPLAYCFLARSINYTELNTWIDDVISKTAKIGFRVVAFVSNQGSIFLNLARERNFSVDKPYFYINENKIYYIFDVPHLVKSLRNNLMKCEFEFLDKDGIHTAKWEDVQTFYRQDCERKYRLAPKLTQSHISPNNIEKLKVKYATQVFSSTVAAAMNCSIEFGRLHRTCLGTVKLIELIDKAFDVLNSSVLNGPNEYKVAFAKLPHQIEILNSLDYFLSNVTVSNSNKENVTNAIKCLKGFKITLNSITSLSQDLQSEGFSFLFTRRLNQDPFYMFFDSVREQSVNSRKPTPIQFSKAFKKLFISDIFKHSKHSNCPYDFALDQLLMKIDALSSVPEDENLQNEENTIVSIAVGTVDYRFDLPENNPFVYVCSYMLKKCFDFHKCKGIEQYMKKNKVNNNSLKDKSVNQSTLLNPPDSFVKCVRLMDVKIKLFLQNNILDSVGTEILKEISDISVDDCCSCFPNDYMRKLFTRFRIFNSIRFNNRLFSKKSFKGRYFSVNNIE